MNLLYSAAKLKSKALGALAVLPTLAVKSRELYERWADRPTLRAEDTFRFID